MECSEAMNIVYGRIKKFESDSDWVTKIMAYIFYHQGEMGMIRVALAPDNFIIKLIQDLKIQIGLDLESNISIPNSPYIKSTATKTPRVSDLPIHLLPFSCVSPPPYQQSPPHYWDPRVAVESDFDGIPFDSILDKYRFCNQPPFIGFEDQLDQESNYRPLQDVAFRSVNGSQHSNSFRFPMKACHYFFNKGFCKHGSNCRYFHGQSFPESHTHMYYANSNELANEDQVVSPGSLEKLEMEITELLKPERGPVSIASLPLMYFEKYGKTLQADGYLTESQRQGKAGYSLTKLLARLKNSILLIERPHGQHSVILVEDAPKYMENRAERNDPGPIVSGSRQIYLTFPAESTFTEDDVSNYFSTFGSVQDVRIPCQQKRMFGFVTFESADTVKIILSKGNPHYVCGARVLVKPYREKSKHVDRKFPEKVDRPMYYHSHEINTDFELHARWQTSRLLRKQLMEDQEQALEIQRMCLSQLRIAKKPPVNQSYFGYTIEELKDETKLSSAENLNYYLLDVLKNSGSTSDADPKSPLYNNTEHDSQGLNLPDSPFGSQIGSRISTVT